ncbi:helix-turn-helix transcriptional regulator [Actibacterium pelagium]|nr:AraC family transcriptional regulator [Actibacterium pelagium]
MICAVHADRSSRHILKRAKRSQIHVYLWNLIVYFRKKSAFVSRKPTNLLRAEKIEPTIRERVWSTSPSESERHWTGALLVSGTAHIEDAHETLALAPVSIFLAPVDKERTFRIQAGGEAVICTIPEQVVLTSIGRGPDSADIRRVLERPAVSQLLDKGGMVEQAERAFDTIQTEARQEAPGQQTMIEASLKMIFGMLLRNIPETVMPQHVSDRGSNLLLRFRQLLENRFRDRWTVAQYASELGISPDRLHDLCTEKLSKSPSVLIRDRTIYEAQMMLARSSISIKEISDRLGFRDPAHFSKYFKSASAESPRMFRDNLAQQLQQKETPALNFADWP